jgi:peptide/nickel transport system substrate-binding protein
MNLSKRIGASVIAIALAGSALAGAAPAYAAHKTDLVLGAIIDVKSWDPSQADIGHLAPFYQAVYDTLILRTPDGKYKPNLATSWKLNADNTEMTLSLRSGVKFTDGAAFDATVAKANLDNFIKGNGPQAGTLAGATVSVVDASTITIKLVDPNPELAYYLSTTDSFMASPKALGTAGLKTTPVGSGPYIFDAAASSAGAQEVFNANPNYWDKSKIKFKKVTFKVMSDVTARLNALLSGQIDATILDTKTSPTAKARKMTQYLNNVDWQGLLIFDRAGKINPALKNVKVRQAIAHAINRPALLKALQNGQGELTNQPFAKTSPAYDTALDKSYPFDIKKAKQLLTEGNATGGFDLTMPAWPDPTMNAVLGDQLKAVGINVTWTQVPAADYRNAMKSGKYAAGVYQLFQGTPWVAINQMATPNGSWNILKSTDPVIDRALKSLKDDASEKNLNAQAKVINRFLTESAWYIPFYRVPQLYFTGSRVKTVNQAQNAIPYLYNYAPTGK